MSGISTHILDAVLGKPAAGVAIRLEKRMGNTFAQVSNGITDADGRCRGLAPEADLGTYRITFYIAPYFEQLNRKSIYPEIMIIFEVANGLSYHLPLLLSDNSYTTYRGS